MQTNFRDDAIARNRLILKLTLLWALGSTMAVMVLALLCFYVIKHKETHWLPVCTGAELSIGDSAYSPEYLAEMTKKAADLRLTYNPETIDARYRMLSHLMPANHQEAFKQLLDIERQTVITKNMSSVFYAAHVSVDVSHAQGTIEGELVRTSHGLQLKPRHKTYQLQFSFKNGLLGLQSIKEITDASPH